MSPHFWPEPVWSQHPAEFIREHLPRITVIELPPICSARPVRPGPPRVTFECRDDRFGEQVFAEGFMDELTSLPWPVLKKKLSISFVIWFSATARPTTVSGSVRPLASSARAVHHKRCAPHRAASSQWPSAGGDRVIRTRNFWGGRANRLDITAVARREINQPAVKRGSLKDQVVRRVLVIEHQPYREEG